MMETPDSTPWEVLLEAVEEIAAVPEPSPEGLAARLSAGDVASLLADVDIRFGARSGIVVLKLAPSADLEDLAAAVVRLGPPLDVNVVSPPMRSPDRPDERPGWDRKQSVGHDFGGRRVWFGTETTGGVERLVAISIDFEGPPPDRLPPEDREGPFRLTVSLGWCGGHGEAVLDESRAVRTHDDLPIFVDAGSWETILDRIHLDGTYRGSPVVRIAGRGRLKRRRGRNPSIPGAPKQRYVALIVASLDETRVEGER